MNEPSISAERELTAYLLGALANGNTDMLLTVDPGHIWSAEYRELIVEMQSGKDYASLLYGRTRETALSLVSETSGLYADDLYRIVKDNWVRRELKRAYNAAGNAEYGIDELMQITEDLKRIESSVMTRRRSSAARSFAERLTGERHLIPTGMRLLDAALGGGMELTEKVVIAARPSGGKTSLGCYLARLVVESGEPVGYWSVESPEDQIMRRVIASKKRIPVGTMRQHSAKNPTLSIGQVESVIAEARRLESMGLNILNCSGKTSEQVAMEMLGSPERVCIVDHLQKFRGKDMRLSVGEASNHFADVANAKGKVVIMLSQISRDIEQRTNAEPKLSDLKETGDIEQDADTVIFIQNMSKAQDGSDDIESTVVDVRLVIAKRRDRERGYIPLKWNRAIGEFADHDNIHEPLF